MRGEECRELFRLPGGRRDSLGSLCAPAYRLARAGVYSAGRIDQRYYFAFDRRLYCWVEGDDAKEICAFRKGNGPLSFAAIEGVEGFCDGLAYGEYFSNPGKGAVRIYFNRAGGDPGQWEAAHTFEAGSIEHVHKLVPDVDGGCVWILSGDFGAGAAIWRARHGFEYVERAVSGEQSFRACVGFPFAGGLLYATDTQLERNSVRVLEAVKGRWGSRKVCEINGPCIYGGELKDYFVFATSTEPDVATRGGIRGLLDRSPGPGIINNASDVILCSKKDLSCRVIYSREKDSLPFRLFQFGGISFPEGMRRGNTLFAYNVASKNDDLTTEVFDLDGLGGG